MPKKRKGKMPAGLARYHREQRAKKRGSKKRKRASSRVGRRVSRGRSVSRRESMSTAMVKLDPTVSNYGGATRAADNQRRGLLQGATRALRTVAPGIGTVAAAALGIPDKLRKVLRVPSHVRAKGTIADLMSKARAGDAAAYRELVRLSNEAATSRAKAMYRDAVAQLPVPPKPKAVSAFTQRQRAAATVQQRAARSESAYARRQRAAGGR